MYFDYTHICPNLEVRQRKTGLVGGSDRNCRKGGSFPEGNFQEIDRKSCRNEPVEKQQRPRPTWRKKNQWKKKSSEEKTDEHNSEEKKSDENIRYGDYFFPDKFGVYRGTWYKGQRVGKVITSSFSRAFLSRPFPYSISS